MGTADVAGHDRDHGRRRRRRSRRRRGRDGHAAAGGHRRGRQRARSRVGRSRRCSPASPTRSSPRRDLDVPVSYEGFQAIGSGMGSAGFIVYDDTTCMVDAAYRFSRFLSIESCGQCPPCKLGSSAITEHLERIETGVGCRRRPRRDHRLAGSCHRRQPLLPRGRGADRRVSSILRAFPEEFAEHIELGRCPRPRRLPIPKLIDLADGHADLRRVVLAQAARLDLRPGQRGRWRDGARIVTPVGGR